MTSELRAALAEQKPAVIAFLQQSQTSRAAAQDRIPRVGPGPSVLSSAQERLWFLGRWHVDDGLYNVAEAFGLEGVVDVGALRVAVLGVVGRQEVLRSRFVTEGGGGGRGVLGAGFVRGGARRFVVVDGVDVVGDVVGDVVEVVDLSGLP